MSFTLGFDPEELNILLSRFGDFVAALIYDDDDPTTVNAWPDDVEIELRFYATATATTASDTWPATITVDRAAWHKTATEVAAQLDSGAVYVRLSYTSDDTGQLEWAKGPPGTSADGY